MRGELLVTSKRAKQTRERECRRRAADDKTESGLLANRCTEDSSPAVQSLCPGSGNSLCDVDVTVERLSKAERVRRVRVEGGGHDNVKLLTCRRCSGNQHVVSGDVLLKSCGVDVTGPRAVSLEAGMGTASINTIRANSAQSGSQGVRTVGVVRRWKFRVNGCTNAELSGRQ